MSEYGEESASVLDPGTLEELLRQLQFTDVDELEVVRGNARIYIRREPGRGTVYTPKTTSEVAHSDLTVAISAPLTGIYYGRPAPEQSAFVTEGDSVEPGQVVALIETMKLFNEVTAELFGEVTRVAVADDDLVELGQALMYIRPTDAGGDR